MSIIAKDSGIVNDEARLMGFPAPMSAAAEQILISAMGAGMQREDDGLLIKHYQRFGAPEVAEKGTEEEENAKAKELDVKPTGNPRKVLFVGLGAMGKGMALSVQKAGIKVVGCDVNQEVASAFQKAGGETVKNIQEGAKEADVVVLMPNTAAQAEAILFGEDGNGICSGMSFCSIGKIMLICQFYHKAL
jgi:3-hydroxyisobutyrate dehydrogenase-like beta-hydroxyacid dehydrogenase